MDLSPYKDCFIAALGASGTFIGLLFVALSVTLADRSEESEMEFTDRRLAESAFTSLAVIFFISLCTLIPGANFGYIALFMAIVGLRSSWQLFARFKENRTRHSHRAKSRSDMLWILLSLAVYLALALVAARIIIDPSDHFDIDIIVGILLWLFGMGLLRSWALTGIRTAG